MSYSRDLDFEGKRQMTERKRERERDLERVVSKPDNLPVCHIADPVFPAVSFAVHTIVLKQCRGVDRTPSENMPTSVLSL